MTKSGPILVVGLDACDPAIAQQLAMQGKLPTLRRLFDGAARCDVRNPIGLFVGALWMTFATGVRADRHHFHCWDQIDVETYVRQLKRPLVEQAPFWRTLSDAGRRIAIFDVPHQRADYPVNGFQMVEWGCHDRHFGFHSWPPKAAADIDAAFGLHPVLGIDGYSQREFSADDYVHRAGHLRTIDENRALFDGLMQGIKTKRKLMKTILAEGGWDLVLAVFGESHSIGHQQWHLHDPTHRRYDPVVAEAVGGDPIPRIYRELDESLGELLSAAGDDTTVLVMLSHGMGPHNDGCHLLDEILTRIDWRDRGRSAENGAPSRKRGTLAFPGRAQHWITAFAIPAIQYRMSGRLPAPCPEFATPRNRARQQFFLEPNNTAYGGIRLNIAGREPKGCVQPYDVDRVVKQLTDDLLAIVNVDTGRPAVNDVIRSDRWYRRTANDTIPDLFVDWAHDAPIETVRSSKIGIVHGPYTHWRTGDHKPHGVLLAYGPGIPNRTTLSALDIEDLAPGIAARLGVELPDVDGRAPTWLAA